MYSYILLLHMAVQPNCLGIPCKLIRVVIRKLIMVGSPVRSLPSLRVATAVVVEHQVDVVIV